MPEEQSIAYIRAVSANCLPDVTSLRDRGPLFCEAHVLAVSCQGPAGFDEKLERALRVSRAVGDAVVCLTLPAPHTPFEASPVCGTPLAFVYRTHCSKRRLLERLTAVTSRKNYYAALNKSDNNECQEDRNDVAPQILSS